MTDRRYDPPETGQRSPLLGEAIDLAVRRITTGIVIAGALVGLGIYARPGPPRFDAFAVGDRIVRVDSLKGTIIACDPRTTCELILRKGQELQQIERRDAVLPAPAAAPATPVPATPAAGK